MNPNDINNETSYETLVKIACRSTRKLFDLIDKNKIPINETLSNTKNNRLPLVIAIKEESVPLVNLLLDKGADPNARNGLPLTYSIFRGNLDIVKILLAKGANPNITPGGDAKLSITGHSRFEIVHLLVEHGAEITIHDLRDAVQITRSEKTSILNLLLDRTCRLADDPKADETAKMLGKLSQLCKCILDGDAPRLTELLAAEDCGKLLVGECDRQHPGSLAVRFNRLNLVCIFLEMGYGLNEIYFEALRELNVEAVELCAKCPGFNPRVLAEHGDSALHLVATGFYCSEYMDIVEILVQRYGLSFNARNYHDQTPLFYIGQSEAFDDLFAIFPDLSANQRSYHDKLLLALNTSHCLSYSVLLEHGADPSLDEDLCHTCTEAAEYSCEVIEYLQTLIVIDQDYAKRLAVKILPIDIESYSKLCEFDKGEHEVEIAKMRSLRISQSTSSTPAKNLFDVIFFGANQAARFSKNEIFLNLYEEHNEDFRNFLPHYGFALNFQLRKGTIRQQKLESALDFLCSALGIGLPDYFAEVIFGSFNNEKLNQFSLDQTEV